MSVYQPLISVHLNEGFHYLKYLCVLFIFITLPLYATSAVQSVLFKPWNYPSVSEVRGKTAGCQFDCIQLPKVKKYKELESHRLFASIKSQFLNDIQELKDLAPHFVGSKFDENINVFYNNIHKPSEDFKTFLLPLYEETRVHLRCLLTKMKCYKRCYQNDDIYSQTKDYIASVLQDCLEGIDLCPAGVYGRFKHSYIDLEASEAGLIGRLFKVRKTLFHEFIHSFLADSKRKGIIDISSGMDTHWANSFYNLFCDELKLPSVHDQFAPSSLSKKLVMDFMSLAELSVSRSTIVRKLANDWSDNLKNILQQEGMSKWETDDITVSDFSSDIAETLSNKLFKPISSWLGTKKNEDLGLGDLIDKKGENVYSLVRYREKLLAWVTRKLIGSQNNHLKESKVRVFTVISKSTNNNLYIGTMGGVFFWVFEHDQCFRVGKKCIFEADNHTTLELSHLTSTDFFSQPEVYALLTQALDQTDRPEDIASFFMNPDITDKLCKARLWLTNTLSNQLTFKLVHNSGDFNKILCQCVCDKIINSGEGLVSPKILSWLINTPLLEPVLLNLQKYGLDITSITPSLCSWQISDFSEESIKQLLTPNDCRRLFKQAYILNQKKLLSCLLLTGNCDKLISLLRDNLEILLDFFECRDILPGVAYLLGRYDVNGKDVNGDTILSVATNKGHVESVKALLAAGAITDFEDTLGVSPLYSAASKGDVGCVKALLMATDIRVNAQGESGLTALACAAINGHAECIKLLLAAGACVNIESDDGSTPLNYAAGKGHLECVKVLRRVDGIHVNKRDINRYSPLQNAAMEGYQACVAELLRAKNIEVNQRTRLFGCTALMLAIECKKSKCARALIRDSRTDLNTLCYPWSFPLGQARKYQLTWVELMLEYNSRFSLWKTLVMEFFGLVF
ncbi:MAG: ankyrin repeat domain-containing protein [Candidatus Endonucleobacter bathymodioli]|uniref:Ankyrin repeat domain-containing protein n=1 Tax=Candidatus Endonucleibacter bathymodioli TaxID=539814 RepID=A0AA90NXF9_9GAMM|nr:ankyrin repeat domain-containing protein [Candidatus Endonucleobacter bathymodioli]